VGDDKSDLTPHGDYICWFFIHQSPGKMMPHQIEFDQIYRVFVSISKFFLNKTWWSYQISQF